MNEAIKIDTLIKALNVAKESGFIETSKFYTNKQGVVLEFEANGKNFHLKIGKTIVGLLRESKSIVID